MEAPTDEEILEQFGVPETRHYAFNLLVRRYQQPLYHFIRRMVYDHDDTDDILQNVFIKVWNHLDRFRGEAKLRTWLYRIASNETMNHLNRQKRYAMLRLSDVRAELETRLVAQSAPEAEEIESRLHCALLRLPQRQRMVFQLRYYEEMNYREMAQVLNLTEGALKASYHHAVRKIEHFLKQGD